MTTVRTKEGMITLEVLQDIEALYNLLQDATDYSERYESYNKIESYLENFPWARRYYGLMPRKHFYRDRVVKLKSYDFVEFKRTGVNPDDWTAPGTYNSEWDTREMHFPREFNGVSGLYFLGMVNTNPVTNETFYWVKIGYASDLLARMRTYNSHCPMLWHIDYTDNTNEIYYHQRLNHIALAKCNHNEEWFLVDRATYLTMCEQGFSYFD